LHGGAQLLFVQLKARGQYLRISDQLLTSTQYDVCIQIGDTNKLLFFKKLD
jgi:hypothetical protein